MRLDSRKASRIRNHIFVTFLLLLFLRTIFILPIIYLCVLRNSPSVCAHENLNLGVASLSCRRYCADDGEGRERRGEREEGGWDKQEDYRLRPMILQSSSIRLVPSTSRATQWLPRRFPACTACLGLAGECGASPPLVLFLPSTFPPPSPPLLLFPSWTVSPPGWFSL